MDAHMGLCSTQHGPHYNACKALAKRIETAFGNDLVGSLILFHGSSDGVNETEMLAFLAHKRGRTAQVQITHTFAKCKFVGDWGVEFTKRPGCDDVFAFQTPWHIALHFLQRGCGELRAQVLECKFTAT
eukprot:8235058-Alexandrium_andersonii.AAC.1